MAPQRRTPRGGPGGTTGPGSRTQRGRSAVSRPTTPAEARPGADARSRRPRLTGRAAVLVLVLAVLTVSYASSLRAYIQQRSHISDLKTAIAEREASINDLEREKQRWEDPAYVKAQARARFGYLMPGETGFQVLDENGQPLEQQATLNDPDDVLRIEPTAWWSPAWDSVELAGTPPAPQPETPSVIDGVKLDKSGQQ
ncbi:FtsB family cell division protein [Nocardioides terrigena]|uniref:FtsB family cell division protein n=1 Tax=Nocardioides terrigena TaxID=424797 RepID=UPI000D2F8C95|nr:septum formation initiator family protein [Nocardioides terrigena]